jgi:prepilin-type N-terminal cleavage/methylation domain-containing protein
MTIFYKKNLRGFTFIEVIVVMAIISIMAGIVAVSFKTGRVEKELETNAREFAGIVREAQNYALTGKAITGSGIPSGAVPCRFLVAWSGGIYKINYIYKNNSSDICDNSNPYSPSYLIVTYNLKNGVKFSNNSDESLSFALPHADLDFSGSKSVIFTKESNNYAVCIYSDGRITDHSGTNCP